MTHTVRGCRICRRVIVGVALVLTFAVGVWWAHGEERTVWTGQRYANPGGYTTPICPEGQWCRDPCGRPK